MRFYRSAAVVLPLFAAWGLVQACSNSSNNSETQADAERKPGAPLPLELMRDKDCKGPATYQGVMNGQVGTKSVEFKGPDNFVKFTVQQGTDTKAGPDPTKRFALKFQAGTGDDSITCQAVLETTTEVEEKLPAGALVTPTTTATITVDSDRKVVNYSSTLSLYNNFKDFVCKTKIEENDTVCTFKEAVCSADQIGNDTSCTGGIMVLDHTTDGAATRNVYIKLAGTCAPASAATGAAGTGGAKSGATTAAANPETGSPFYLTLKASDTLNASDQKGCKTSGAAGSAGAAGAAGAAGSAGNAGAAGAAGKVGAAGKPATGT